VDLHFNMNAAFTKWAVTTGALREPFVVVDVGVQGGESPRWHQLGDHLVVHGFDAIEEVVEALRLQHRSHQNRHYHWIAAGNTDEETTFYVNTADPCSSSFFKHGSDRFGDSTKKIEQARSVAVRRLDTLLSEGIIAKPDFLKIDVEGFEKDVLLGARATLASVLGVETESNFSVSPLYPKSHFVAVQELLLEHQLLVFDINFNRIPRATFQRALERKNLPPILDQSSIGKPAILNVLFCRDVIEEVDHSSHYLTQCRPISVDQLIKLTMVYELHGLNDIALDTVARFRDLLAPRFDVEHAAYLLADPNCRRPNSRVGIGENKRGATTLLRDLKWLLARGRTLITRSHRSASRAGPRTKYY
jgi:FkbM family methyltransferase